MNKRSHIHKKADSSASNPVLSQFQSRPFIAQAKPQSEKPLTQTETENQEFQQQKFEATKLELQAKYGTITPLGQERLTVLQAKMSGLLQRRLEHASSNGSNFAKIPISPPDAPSQQVVQTKLTIGEPGDKYEREADRVAEQVVKQIHAPASQQPGQSQPVQREELAEQKKELQMKPMLQLRSGKVGMAAAPEVEASINQARGGGQPLTDSIREPMEQAFGTDFGSVKIHTDSRSHQLNQSIQARAFTTGQDIFFRQGEYAPQSQGGKKLLAHELTHVVQQNGSALGRKSLPDVEIKKNKIQAEALLNSPSGYPSVIQRGVLDKIKNKFKDGGDQIEEDDQIEEIEVNGEDWKKYMELETLNMKVEDITTDTQIGHNLLITIIWYNKSQKRLRLMTPPPLVYFEEITKITTTNGNRNTETESVDQYARNSNSNTFRTYKWGVENKSVDPGQRLKVQFLDPPQITKTPEYKSRAVKFRLGVKGSEQWITGVQQLSCENEEIIEHDFTRT